MTKKRTSGLKARAATTTSPMEQDLQAMGLLPAPAPEATTDFAPMTNENGDLVAQTETPIIDALEASLVGEAVADPIDPDTIQDFPPTEGEIIATEEPLDADQQALNDAVANLDQAAAEALLDAEADAVTAATIMAAEDALDDEMSDEELLASLAGKTDEEVDLTLGLASDELPVPDAAHAVGEEDTAAMDAPAPEGDQPEQTVLSAEEANTLFAEGGIEALVGRSFHPFTTEDGTQVDDGATGVTASPIPTLAPIKRTSRIAPLAGKVVATLKEGKKSVPEMAKMFEVAERDIRLAIDKARAQGEKIERLAPKVFGYPEKVPARRRLTANPSAATPVHQEPAH